MGNSQSDYPGDICEFAKELNAILKARNLLKTALAHESGLSSSIISDMIANRNRQLTRNNVLRCIEGLIRLRAITDEYAANRLLQAASADRKRDRKTPFELLDGFNARDKEVLDLLERIQEERSDFGKMLHEDFLELHNITQKQLAEKSRIATKIISEMVTGEWSEQGQALSDDLYAIFTTLAELCSVISIVQADNLLKTIPEINLNKERRIHLLTRLIRENSINPSHLTLHQTPFIGRDEDIKEIYFRLQKMQKEGKRFLTLVGLPGVGKTELARQIRLLDQSFEFFGQVLAISLEASTSISEVLEGIIKQLEEAEQLGNIDQQTRTLIILDNCELFEDIDEARTILYECLDRVPQHIFLATSRTHFSDEEYEVKPLGMPNNKSESVEKLQTYDAIKLFLAYANFNAPVLELTEETKETIAAICIKLDALPLALLLAGSLVEALGIDGLYNLIHESDIQTLEYSLAENVQHRTFESDPYKVLGDFVEEDLEADIEMLLRVLEPRPKIDVSMFKEEDKEVFAVIKPQQLVLTIIRTDDIQALEYSQADNNRHRTLEKLLAASYDLLLEQEQELFRRLGIFFAPCSLEAVINVCDLGDKPQIINLLNALKRQHLIDFKDERIAISHNIIRSFARRRIKVDVKEDISIWDALMVSFKVYYIALKQRYLDLRIENEPLVESSRDIIENFANIKAYRWMTDIERKVWEIQRAIADDKWVKEYQLIFQQRYRHPVRFIKYLLHALCFLFYYYCFGFFRGLFSNIIKFK